VIVWAISSIAEIERGTGLPSRTKPKMIGLAGLPKGSGVRVGLGDGIEL